VDKNDMSESILEDICSTAPNGTVYIMPTEGPINDGIWIDKGASKWKLNRTNEGAIHVEGKTIRLKVFPGKFYDEKTIYKNILAINPQVAYQKARDIGSWMGPDFKHWSVNLEIDLVVTFLTKKSWVGAVIGSACHDKPEEFDKDTWFLSKAGFSVHAGNLSGKGTTERKFELQHPGDGDEKNGIPKSLGYQDTTAMDKFGNVTKTPVYLKWLNTFNPDTQKLSSKFYIAKPGKKLKLWNDWVTDKSSFSTGVHSIQGVYVIFKSNDSEFDIHEMRIREISP
jgi:hypothetical protein